MRRHRFGALAHDRGVLFRVWAPAQREVALVREARPDVQMARDDDGFFTADVEGATAGEHYWFRLAQGLRPDPASRFQPDGPFEASQVVDHRGFRWTDQGWRGAPLPHRQAIYELHLGTFTTEGTWLAAARDLPRLADLGVTTLEVMPVAEFAGSFGWGYDGVQLFAPSRLYGTPDDARHFVNVAHRLGLAVILDVVYNHLGPAGNFIRDFAPTFLGAAGEWGELINFDDEQVRAFMVDNAVQWIADYHFDGLRFDATQAIVDRSAEHIISEICREAREAAGSRQLFFVGESEPQDIRFLRRSGTYPDGLDAIWSEDWHHAAFVTLTGRRHAYFTDYLGTAAEFASMARHGTLYQGQWYSWQTAPRGGYALHLDACAFVNFLENHDQIANTGAGSRLAQQVNPASWRALTALLLLGPAMPMLFQGQEFGSTRPFTYFADHEGDLGRAVHEGRLQFLTQFPGLGSKEVQEQISNPGDADAFAHCKLSEAERTADHPITRLYRDLLHLRRDDPVLTGIGGPDFVIDSSAPTASVLLVRYLGRAGHRLLIVNLGRDHVSSMNDPLLAPAPGSRWDLSWSSEDPTYAGSGVSLYLREGRWRFPAHSASLLHSVLL
jgi:maltooligosyltrehalose trehalohydrolase